jgi:Arc/MetJ-type ribon-helix-helix transcriptional regulator
LPKQVGFKPDAETESIIEEIRKAMSQNEQLKLLLGREVTKSDAVRYALRFWKENRKKT